VRASRTDRTKASRADRTKASWTFTVGVAPRSATLHAALCSASRTDRTKASRADRTGASWTLSVDRALPTCDLTPQLHTRSHDQCPEECDSPRGPVQLTITPAPTISVRDRGVQPATISQPRASLLITSIDAARSARQARDAAIVDQPPGLRLAWQDA
jgi:hypothetical protein